MNCQGKDSRPNIKWKLVGYDLFIYVIAVIMLLGVYGGMDKLSVPGMVQQTSLSAASIFAARFLGKVYKQVWRYGGIQCYIRLLFTDMIAFINISVYGTFISGSKSHVCKNAFLSEREFIGCISYSYGVSLCI